MVDSNVEKFCSKITANVCYLMKKKIFNNFRILTLIFFKIFEEKNMKFSMDNK